MDTYTGEKDENKTVLWGNITSSEMRKQTIKVYIEFSLCYRMRSYADILHIIRRGNPLRFQLLLLSLSSLLSSSSSVLLLLLLLYLKFLKLGNIFY